MMALTSFLNVTGSTQAKSEAHLKAGAKRVNFCTCWFRHCLRRKRVLTADDKIVSAGSCTAH